MNEEYKADTYMRMAQRFIQPLFFKDGCGGYNFSSTATFVKYRDEYFCVFAAHAVPLNETRLDNIGFLSTHGSFISLNEICKRSRIFKEHDIGICNTTAPFEHKNYFDLDAEESTTNFKSEAFGWIGFPKKKAKEKYHRTKASEEHITNDLSVLEDGTLKWTNARFLCLGVELIQETEDFIKGHFDNENVTYEQEGFKSKAYSLRGMSGGALFQGPDKINSENPTLNDFYKFAGIGLEHRTNEKTVGGASRHIVKTLISQLLSTET